MNKELENIAIEKGDRLKVISVKHLGELQELLDNFMKEEELNEFQKWIIKDLYRFGLPEVDFDVKSVILIAIHHPFYAEVEFCKDGRKNQVLSLVRADFRAADNYLADYMRSKEYSIRAEYNLPIKRLAVHSGLAKYGRNNITYIDGMGSNFSYAAYFTDMPCEEDTWGEVNNAKACEKCNACIDNCPTKAIRADRFLIDNQKCLSCLNEMPGEFPEWLPESIHHTIYDCLICQRICPMNAGQKNKILRGISFNEEETNMLLEGKPLDAFTEEAQDKIRLLGMDEWYAAMPRNLSIVLGRLE
jgi:Uncharacterized Fe-S protein